MFSASAIHEPAARSAFSRSPGRRVSTGAGVGITARVLGDLGRLQDAAAKVVLGAAVVDDILGLIILAVVTGVAQTGNVSVASVGDLLAGFLSGKAIVFLVVAIVAGVGWLPC